MACILFLYRPFDGLHAKRNAFPCQFRFVHGANFRRLVLVFEQMSPFMFAKIWPPGMTDLPEPTPERKMASGLFTGGKVVVVPAFRRHEQTSRPPIHPDHFLFFSRVPHNMLLILHRKVSILIPPLILSTRSTGWQWVTGITNRNPT